MIERVLMFFLGVHESVLVDFVSQNLLKLSVAGVGKLFVRRATFEKNVAAEGRTLSLQNRKFTLCVKKTHIHIKHSFRISHSGTFNAI